MTTVKQSFKYDTIDGRLLIPFAQWITTLSKQEQQEFQAADERQKQHRQVAIDRGDMTIDSSGEYIWKDSATAKSNKPTDLVWLNYFNRWQKECGIVFKTEFQEE